MTDDTTLSDFQDADADLPSEDAPDPERDGPDATAGEDVDPVVPTAAWGEYTCKECGATVERVWREDGRYLCPACTSW